MNFDLETNCTCTCILPRLRAFRGILLKDYRSVVFPQQINLLVPMGMHSEMQ